MSNQVEINNLFQKYLSGEYSEKELDMLLAFFKLPEHESHRLTEMILQELDRPIPDQDRKRAEELADKIGQNLFKKIDTPVRSLYRPIKIAAGILLFLLVGSAVYWYNTDNPSDTVKLVCRYGDDVLPGGNRAMITLDDGTQVVLDESKDSKQYKSCVRLFHSKRQSIWDHRALQQARAGFNRSFSNSFANRLDRISRQQCKHEDTRFRFNT